MTREINGQHGSKAEVLTRGDDQRINSGNLSLRVTGEGGRSGQMTLSRDQALALVITLIQTAREVSEG